MIQIQDIKHHNFILPLDINGTTATDVELDTQGWSYLMVIATTGNVAANMTALKFQTNDVAATSEADITGGAWATLPLASGGDNLTWIGYLDLRSNKCKRYVSVVATAGAGATLIHVQGILFNPVKTPTTAAERGATEQFIIS